MVRRRSSRQKIPTFMLLSWRFYFCVVVGSMVCLGVGCFCLKGSSSSAEETADSSVRADTLAPTPTNTNKEQSAISTGGGQTNDAQTPYNNDVSYGDSSSIDVKRALRSGVGSVTTRRDSRMLPVVAHEILQNYQTSQSCVLVSSGYLDLWGNAWMCMVSGGAWVEMCLVTDKDQTSSEVQILRMTTSEWEAAYGSTSS